MSVVSKSGAWLVRRDTPAAPDAALERPVTRIGRAADNDIVVAGADAATVSSYHAEIRREDDQYRLNDCDSTNGTYLDGRLVREATLEPHCVIRLGPHGPEFVFELRQPPRVDLDATVVLPDPPTKVPLEPAG